MSRVRRKAANIVRAIVELRPGGALITEALDKHGVFEKVGTWVEKQISTIRLVWWSIRDAIDQFLGSLSWRDIFHLGDVWDRAKQIFTTPMQRIAEWPAVLKVGRNISAPESGRLGQVAKFEDDNPRFQGPAITYKLPLARGGPGSTLKSYAAFMQEWRTIIERGGEDSPAQRRARLIQVLGPVIGAAVPDAADARDDLAKNLGIYDRRHAHHIIPISLLDPRDPSKNKIVRLLLHAAGWDYNAAVNGEPLAAGFHGSHEQYTMYVQRQVDRWVTQRGDSAADAFRIYATCTLIPAALRVEIGRAQKGGKTLNEYFRTLPR